jgi:segregation and condensation protein A
MEALRQSFVKLLERIKPLPPLPETRIDKAISIREKIEHIRVLLKNAEKVSFSELLNDSKNRTEVIASFLALLELVKDESVALKQKGSFCDIMIEKI